MMASDQCLDIFPLEVWEAVLGHLEHEDLLTSRLVCKAWRQLVDDTFTKDIWSCHFAKNRVADVLSTFLVKCRGTRFGTGEDVDAFIEAHERSEEPHQNPFLNHTIILNCRSIDQYTGLCNKFPMLIERYGHHVRHCLYFVHYEVPVSVRYIPLIFHLRNLHTLTIYCADWDKRGLRNILEPWTTEPLNFPQLKYFKNLNILGDRGYTVLKTLFSQYGGQIKRLNCWGHNLMEDASRDFARDVTETITNLEEFKVCDVSSTLLSSVCTLAQWPLKRLSVKISFSDDTINLGCLMDSLKKYGPTLESFHLQVDERQLHNSVFLFDICFPKLRDLRVPFYFIRGMPYYLFDLAKKFPVVEHLQLVDSEDNYESWLPYTSSKEKKISQVVESMWHKLPTTIKVVSVRYRKDGEQRGGLLVYKYRKVRVPKAADDETAGPSQRKE